MLALERAEGYQGSRANISGVAFDDLQPREQSSSPPRSGKHAVIGR